MTNTTPVFEVGSFTRKDRRGDLFDPTWVPVEAHGHVSDCRTWGIHDTDDGWEVIHIPTGMPADPNGKPVRLLAHAIRWCKLLAEEFQDWNFADPQQLPAGCLDAVEKAKARFNGSPKS